MIRNAASRRVLALQTQQQSTALSIRSTAAHPTSLGQVYRCYATHPHAESSKSSSSKQRHPPPSAPLPKSSGPQRNKQSARTAPPRSSTRSPPSRTTSHLDASRPARPISNSRLDAVQPKSTGTSQTPQPPAQSPLYSQSQTPSRTNSPEAPEAAESRSAQRSTDATSPAQSESQAQQTQSSATAPTEAPATPKRTIRSRIRDLYTQLKFLFKFYLNGVKQIWRDRQRVQAIRQQCSAEGGRALTWGEANLVRTHQSDLRKLPLFLAILIIVEEVLPLVVIYAPFLLPSTCILPSQLLKIRHGEEVKRAAAAERLRAAEKVKEVMAKAGLPGPSKGLSLGADSAATHQDFAKQFAEVSLERATATLARASSGKEITAAWKTLDRDTLVDLSAMFALPTRLRPTSMLRMNLERHAKFVVRDDALLSSALEEQQTSQQNKSSLENTSTEGPIDDAKSSDTGAAQQSKELANFPEDVPTLSSALSLRGLQASESPEEAMTTALKRWVRMTTQLVAARAIGENASTAAESASRSSATPSVASVKKDKAVAVDVLFLPLSLYPPPKLFTPSLVAPKTVPDNVALAQRGRQSADAVAAQAAQAEKEGGLLQKSKEVVDEVVEAEEKREAQRKKEEEEREKAQVTKSKEG